MSDAKPERTLSPTLRRKLQRAADHLNRGELREARDLCTHLLTLHPDAFPLLMLSGKVAQRAGDVGAARLFAQRACQLRPRNVDALVRLATCALYDSDTATTLRIAEQVERAPDAGAGALRRLSDVYRHLGRHDAAFRCLARALERDTEHADTCFDAALAAASSGEFDTARTLLERVIFLAPDDHEAWYWRVACKGVDGAQHHIKELGYVLDHLAEDDPGRVSVCYALARELELIGEYDFSFRCLVEGARVRNERDRYEVTGDEQAIQDVAETWNAEALARPVNAKEAPAPLFIVGLPESGAAWLARWLGAHAGFSALSNTETLNYAVLGVVGPHASGEELLQRSLNAPMEEIAVRYARAVTGLGLDEDTVIDPGERNFLYLGLIHQAFPNARIVHLRREPLDHCYALFRRLFERSVPYGGRLENIVRYYTAYHRLMGHWRRHLGDRFLDVDFEPLWQGDTAARDTLGQWLGLDLDPAREQRWPTDPEPGLAQHQAVPLADARRKLLKNGVPLD